MQMETILVQHIKRLRWIEKFKDACIVLQIESNMMSACQLLYKYIKQNLPEEEGRIVPIFDAPDRIGGMTTSTTKELQAHHLCNCMRSAALYCMDPIVATESDGDKMKNILFSQLGMYSKDKKGRLSGKIAGMQDDLATCLMMTLYYKDKFWADPKYSDWTTRRV